MARYAKHKTIKVNLSIDLGSKTLQTSAEFLADSFDEFYQEFFGRAATEKEQNLMMECLIGECARRLEDQESDVESFTREFFEFEQDKINKRKRRKK